MSLPGFYCIYICTRRLLFYFSESFCSEAKEKGAGCMHIYIYKQNKHINI
jgi:hypothetical protein